MQFYAQVFGYELQRYEIEGETMAFFPWIDNAQNASGSLVVQNEHHKPSEHQGVIIYFSSPSGDIQNELDRVEAAGGKILFGKKAIGGDHGFYANILDTEGNRIAFTFAGKLIYSRLEQTLHKQIIVLAT